ncbi:uncharacterized protein [Nicotiana sylvestris]|uniref:uncharacterized protein n=1 Tax=Nicotiana sylvestris TaxID=4096 RepID=UPI00388C863F
MIEIMHRVEEPKKPSQTVMMIRSSEVRPIEKPTSEKLVIRLSGASSEPSVVVKKGTPSDMAVKQERAKVVVPGVANKPVVIVEGAHTDPVIIKLVTHLPIVNSKAVPWNYERVTMTYKGKEKAVTKEEVEEFLRKMKVQDYSIVEQLRQTPAQISLLSLMIHLDEHRRALMKILNEAHVPEKILVNHLEKIANKIFEVNRVTFSDDELPVEGTEHNRALYLPVKCEDSVVTRVLIDNGSSANIFPLSTLNNLKVEDERIHKNNICIRGFDGGGKDSVGDIVLELTIGPVEFTMEFQVLDVAVSYNLLLGRPWIHAAKAVPSTLHQMVKLEWDRQEIMVHGEDNLCAHSNAIVPFIEVEDDKGPWVYQVFDTMSVEKIPEGKGVLVLKVTVASVMLAFEMLKNGFVPGKGLSTDLVVHKLPTDPEFPPVKQKLRKFKTDVSVKIKEEVNKQFDAKVIQVTQYPTWLANVVHVPKKDGKTRAFADHLAENLVDEEYEPLKTYFPDEKVMHIDELEPIGEPGWKLFFDGATNMKGIGIGAVHDQYAYCNVVEEELDGEPWFHDIKEYIRMGVYPVQDTGDQKRIIRRLASRFFFSGGVLYKRTPDLGLLRCIDDRQATTIMTEVHSGVRGPHISEYVLEKKILQVGYYWLTMERDCISFMRKCHQCQVHGDLIYSPPSKLHTMSIPWLFVAWGMDVIGPIDPATSNRHRFILVAIDYFTK